MNPNILEFHLRSSNSNLIQSPSFRACMLFASFLMFWVLWVFPKKGRRLPPGPRGWPVIGNMLDLPRETPWIGLRTMARQWGPIFSLKILAANIIVIDDATIANELLETRNSVYSDRQSSRYADYATGGLALFLMKYNSSFLRMRKAAHSGLTPKAVEEYEPIQEFEAKKMVLGLIVTPDDHHNHAKRYAAAVSLSGVYSIPSVEIGDPLVTRINEIVDRMTHSGVVGRYLVDYIPVLDHFPIWMCPWKQKGISVYNEDTATFQGLVDDVKRSMLDGSRGPSYTSRTVEDQRKSGLTDAELAWVTGIMFAGGSDTTASSISMVIRAMVLNQSVQRKAQAELDKVVGRERLPNFADRKYLPYINAIVKETQRFTPVVPIALHATSEDDEYCGYYIPKGSMVWANIWSINRGKSHEDPDDFKPERYLDSSGNIVVPRGTKEFGHHSFGFGRRICVGRHMASSSLFIDTAVLLWAFSFTKAIEEDGQEVEIDPIATSGSGASIGPAPFKCNIRPRISRLEELVIL